MSFFCYITNVLRQYSFRSCFHSVINATLFYLTQSYLFPSSPPPIEPLSPSFGQHPMLLLSPWFTNLSVLDSMNETEKYSQKNNPTPKFEFAYYALVNVLILKLMHCHPSLLKMGCMVLASTKKTEQAYLINLHTTNTKYVLLLCMHGPCLWSFQFNRSLWKEIRRSLTRLLRTYRTELFQNDLAPQDDCPVIS